MPSKKQIQLYSLTSIIFLILVYINGISLCTPCQGDTLGRLQIFLILLKIDWNVDRNGRSLKVHGYCTLLLSSTSGKTKRNFRFETTLGLLIDVQFYRRHVDVIDPHLQRKPQHQHSFGINVYYSIEQDSTKNIILCLPLKSSTFNFPVLKILIISELVFIVSNTKALISLRQYKINKKLNIENRNSFFSNCPNLWVFQILWLTEWHGH